MKSRLVFLLVISPLFTSAAMAAPKCTGVFLDNLDHKKNESVEIKLDKSYNLNTNEIYGVAQTPNSNWKFQVSLSKDPENKEADALNIWFDNQVSGESFRVAGAFNRSGIFHVSFASKTVSEVYIRCVK